LENTTDLYRDYQQEFHGQVDSWERWSKMWPW
jgi:hypothetical protein